MSSSSPGRNFSTDETQPSIVFIPGLLCSEVLFEHQIAHFSQDSECIIFDHTSHGSIAIMVAEFLKTAPERFSIVALSMGGYIAFEIWRQAPERVENLVLMSTMADADTEEKSQDRLRLVEIAKNDGFDRVIHLLYPTMVHPARIEDIFLYQRFAKMAVNAGEQGFQLQQKAIIERSCSRDVLADITAPTLVIVGEQDVITQVDMAEVMSDAIPGAQLEVISGSGHMVPLELPEQTTELLIEFLA